jgi:nucleotide-binding universal stress UspA family protein
MYDQILFPTDGSEPAAASLDYAAQIAEEHDGTLHILNVADTNQESLATIRGEVVDVLEQEGEQIVDEATARASERGISVVSEVVQGSPHDAIVEYSEEFAIDLIVMPTHGRSGLKRVLLGSVTERVINTADVPVISVNPDEEHQPTYPSERILVPVDGSRGAQLALTEGIAVAKATGATLHLLHVVETGSLGPDARSVLKEQELTAQANDIITEAVKRAEAESLDAIVTDIEHGKPLSEIRSYIRTESIDLAILGTHGTTDFSRYVMGGVSAKLVRSAPIPVMWVREADSDGEQ